MILKSTPWPIRIFGSLAFEPTLRKRIIICWAYSPAPSGGIGTYASIMCRLHAKAGEIMHVISQMREHAETPLEELRDSKLTVHRVLHENCRPLIYGRQHPTISRGTTRDLFATDIPLKCFSWQANFLAESSVEQEAIDPAEAPEYGILQNYCQLRGAGRTRKWGMLAFASGCAVMAFCARIHPTSTIMERLEQFKTRHLPGRFQEVGQPTGVRSEPASAHPQD